MFAKVHPAEDVKSGNTGSCHDLVRYLEKETGEGQRFFSHTEQDISPERVIMDIDGNKKALGANDAKFFMLSLNPSQSEQMHLIGRKVDDFKELTPQEKKEVFQKLEAFTRSAMDEYALNFGRDNIRGGQDLMYYARVETERSYHPEDEEVKQGIARIGEPKPGLNLHVHVIVSRKSLDGKVKLSPGAKSAGNTWELEGRGTVKRGFSHEGWKVRVQECFNRKFDYQAKEGETYVRPQVSAEIGKITNPELKRILQDEQFTAANQRADSLKAAAAMKRRTAKARPKKETPKKEEPERTVGRFFSGEEPENKGNTIEAIVSGDQKITNGSVIKLVTLQEMQLPGGMVINKGTAVFGVVKLAQDRINITVESVRIGNSIYEMQKTVYDRDGLPGIYVPLNIKAEATKEAADEVVSDMNVTSYGTDVLSTGVNAVSNAAKSVFRKKNNQVVVTVKSNYKLYLK